MAHCLIFTKVMTLTLPFIWFSKQKLPIVLGLEDIRCHKIRTIGPAVWSVHREMTDRQTNERALGECILCKMLAFYICDWHWLVEDLRHNQFGPNSLTERCIMILFMMKYYYNSRKYVTLTFEIWPWFIFDFWPWYLNLRLIYYYLDASKKNWSFEKN